MRPLSLSRSSGERGSLLVAAVIFIALIAVMLIPVLQHFAQLSRMAAGARAGDQAFYAAESGIARAMSYIFAVGGGEVTGIHDSRFAVPQSAAFNPFNVDWLAMGEGIAAAGADEPAVRVRIWRDAGSEWKIQAVGRATRPRPIYRTVTVTIRAGSFARYAFFNTASLSTMDGLPRWLAPGEVFNGPVHSNRHLFVYGASNNPLVFNSDVTIVGEEVLQSSPQYVRYNGLKDTNADYIELPADLSPLINAAANGGVDLPADDTSIPPGYSDNDAINNYKFVFNENGTVTIINLDAKKWAESRTPPLSYTPMTVPLASTNGAIVVRNGNAFVSGIVNGRATIAALANDANQTLIPPMSNVKSDGNLIIDGNLIYKTHPKVNGSYDISSSRQFDEDTVTDVLGLIAERNFALDGGVPTNCIVDAHIMLTGQASPNPDVRTWPTTTNPNTVITQAINQDGAFFVEDGVQTDLSLRWTGHGANASNQLNNNGTLYLTGGVVHFLRGQTKNGSGGYDRNYTFDQRLLKRPPPFYPLTPDLEIVGWQDVASTTEPE